MSGLGRDILNFPGNIVRGAGNLAGNVVGGTMHAVTSVGNATGIVPRRLSIDGTPVILRDKLTLTVKSTPERTAACMTTLSLKSGPLLKKNEQGVWSKRYATLVPHFFLYYFENNSSKEPQGIIDLEFCTDITVQSDNIIKIGASEVYESRTFFFQADDGTISNEWASAMQRERYGVVKDERDAYHELQDQFSAQLDMAFQQVEISSQEKDRAQAELVKARKVVADAEYFIKKLGTLVGVSEEDIGNGSDMRTYGEAVILATEQMKSSFASQNAYELEIHKQEHEDLHDKIEKLERDLEAEIHSRRLLEAQNTSEKREAELRLRDAVAEVEKATVLVETLQLEHHAVSEKTGELFEQKKILVKEVKHLRKKLAQSEAAQLQSEQAQAELARLNSELVKSSVELKSMLEAMQEKNKLESEEALAGSLRAVELLVNESAIVVGEKAFDDSVASPSDAADNSKGEPGNFQWERRRSSLQSLDWLAPEQKTLLAENAHKDEDHKRVAAHPVADVPGRAEIMNADPIDAKRPSNPYLTDPAEPEEINESFSDKIDKISFSKFVPSMNITSIFKEKEKEKESSSETGSNSEEGSKHLGLHMPKFSLSFSSPSSSGGLFSNSSHGSHTAATSADASSVPLAEAHISSPSAPRCYRCGGTVEGPKYSTCKCPIPAMTPIEIKKEESSNTIEKQGKRGSMSNFMGMLSRGIDKVTPHSRSGSFHPALELDEKQNIDTDTVRHSFIEVEDAGNENVRLKEDNVDLLGLDQESCADDSAHVNGEEATEAPTHDELQADV